MTWRLGRSLLWVAASLYGLIWGITHDDPALITLGILATVANSVALGWEIEKRWPS